MRILCLSHDFSGASICLRLLREGNEVRAFITDPLYRQILDGLIVKVDDLDQGLAWVGRDGLIVVDDVGFGELQDRLRSEGYAVVGGSAGGDLLENDRLHCQRVLAGHGVRPVPSHYFDSRRDAVAFLGHNPGRWVLKQNGGADKTFCYVGSLPDGRDVLDLLEYHGRNTSDDTGHFVLQQYVSGVEIGVGRYFNGHDWLGPVELNLEHKNLFPGCLGPKTYEMGTLMWYDPDESNRLFQEVLAPLAPHLKQIGFRGDFDINCIVNEQGAFPLEATSRFGYPAFQLQTEFHCSPWADFLFAVAQGKSYDLKWRPGYGIVVLVALTPFPFHQATERTRPLPLGLRIHFHDTPSQEELLHFHPDEVSVEKDGDGREIWHTCSDTGYILHVSGMGATVEEARDMAYQRIDNLVLPKMFYRHDIGLRFLKQDRERLTQWGWM